MQNGSSIYKTFLKLTLTLILFICFLCVVIFGIITISTSIWLHTYKTFTQKKLIAEVTTSKLMFENSLPYCEIRYRETYYPSAFESIFSKQKSETISFTEDQEFKVYGDRFEIGAEVIKWNDWLNLLGIDTIYKVSRIKGDSSETELENEATHSAYDINSGVDSTWKYLQKNEEKFSFLVDTIYTSSALKFAEDEEMTWGLYITEDGLILDRLE